MLGPTERRRITQLVLYLDKLNKINETDWEWCWYGNDMEPKVAVRFDDAGEYNYVATATTDLILDEVKNNLARFQMVSPEPDEV